MSKQLYSWAYSWYLTLNRDQQEAIDERIAIQMESNGWTEQEALTNLYMEKDNG